MKWYLAKMVYRIICGSGTHTPQFDEQLRLIEAADKRSAFDKAVAIGKKEEDCFYNLQKQLVKWEFINVSELYRMTDMIDGAEICSRISEVENEEAYITFVQQRAAYIQKEDATLIHELID